MIDSPFLTEEKLMTELEAMVKTGQVNYLEAVLEYCKKNFLDVEDIKPLVGLALKERIRVDAMNTGLMKKEATLPFD